jgi:phenylalanyl-tRNA synthetase beta chain
LEADLAEEIARIYGYEHIPEISVKINADSKTPEFDFTKVRSIRLSLKSLGFNEAINYSFIDENYLQQFYLNNNFIKLRNPISEELNVLRVSIFPSLIKNILSNLRVGQLDIRLFEIAKVFNQINNDGLPCEETHLSIAITKDFWPLNWLLKNTNDSFYIIKGIIDNLLTSLKLHYNVNKSSLTFLHPGKSTDITINNVEVGFVGELHPSFYELLDISTKIYIAELSLNKVLDIAKGNTVKYKKYSIYPYVNKDLSLLFDEDTPVAAIYGLIYSVSLLIKKVYLYDIYKGKNIEEGKKSLTFRIVFSSFDRTLTDKETNEILNTIIDKCKKEFNAILR